MKLILTAVLTYLATSIDEIPVLFMLYKKSDNKDKGKIITAAYATGTVLLIVTGFLGAYGLVQIPAQWMIGLVGLIPLVMGVRILVKGDDDDEEKAITSAQKLKSRFLQVSIITIALGADDLGVYIPLFTTLSAGEIMLMLIIFTFGTALLCIVSYQLTRIDGLASFIERYERFVIGITFIVIGFFVMLESGTLSGITGMLS